MPPAGARLPPALGALLDTAAALARRAPSARVAEARAAALFPEAVRRGPEPQPMAANEVDRLLRSAWGDRPSKVLDRWEADPIAVRPAAQVHRGELDGAALAIKVRRPGLAAMVRADLALVEAVAPAVASAFPALDVAGVLAEIREAALDELDLEHEGDVQRLVGRALRGEDAVVVPRVIGELTTEDVLVTEHVAGRTLHDGARPEDPGAVARALMRAHGRAVRRTGLVPADPRPGHVVVTRDGVALLGLGVARPWREERLDGLLGALSALRDPGGADDLAGVLDARLGVMPADAARTAHALLREVLGDLVAGPARLDPAALARAGRRALARASELAGLAACAAPEPADLAAFRAAGQLAATLAALGATEDWVPLALSEIGPVG